jgi:Zn-dependent protease
MGRSWKIGSAFGIGIYLHWTLLLLPFLVLGNVLWQRSAEDAGLDLETCVLLLLLLPAVFVCLILHELGHALAARAFGIGTRDITMYPIGGVARLERMSEQPGEELCIALAGPAVNLLLAGLLLAPLFLFSLLSPAFADTGLGKYLLSLLVVNLVLVVFNLVPAFPMDGGRVLRALLALAIGHLRATRIAVAVAGILAVLMVFLGLGLMPLGQFFREVNPLLILVAGFVFLMGQRELQLVEWKERQRAEAARAQAQAFPPLPRIVSVCPLYSSVQVYVWDPVRGVWVLEQHTPPAPPAFFDPPAPRE